QVFETLGSLDCPGYHRAHILHFGTHVQTGIGEGSLQARKIARDLPEYAALDLETTGLDPARDRVIEIGAVAFTSDRVTSTLERLVDPGRPVRHTVHRLTGTKQDELRGAQHHDAALRLLAHCLRGRHPARHCD